MNVRPYSNQIKQPERPKLADVMGPGLITGASDDDPSGIATYAQAGAQFGYSLCKNRSEIAEFRDDNAPVDKPHLSP
jgi:hypothetical protein